MLGRTSIRWLAVAGVVGMAGVVACASDDAAIPSPAPNATRPTPVVESQPTTPLDGATAPGDASVPTDAANDALSNDGAEQQDASEAGPLVCAVDADCRGGSCFDGACFCNTGLHIQMDGRCGPTPPAETCREQGGSCINFQPACPSTLVSGNGTAQRSCGDLVIAVCCFDCRPVPKRVVCCFDQRDPPRAPICVQGWPACENGFVARRGDLDDPQACQQ